LFYDSEFGSPRSYFESFGIDTDRIVHTPITDIEQLKFDIMKQLKEINRGERIMIVLDSIGNLASKNEVDDALDGKSVADMSRAKQIKSLFRMVTPHLNLKDIPMIAVAHIYMTQEMYSKPVVSGGTGPYYSADNIYIVGRQQEKDGTELIGYSFIVNVEKSRCVREKAKIPITVTYEGGVSKWSGLLDMAVESGHVIKPSMGWYTRVNKETGEVEAKKYRIKDTDTKEFWTPILESESFKKWVTENYQFASAGTGDLTKEFLDDESEDNVE
jgi:RecA/RadA recombinase